MSELSGSLTDFELSAVMRLLAEGDKTGVLAIHGSTLDGSIFFDEGEVTYATTRTSTVGTAEDGGERRDDETPSYDAVIADVATRLTRQTGGAFVFEAGVESVHEVEQRYSIDEILGMVDLQLALWHDVDVALGSTERPFAMAQDVAAEEKIELSGQDWNVLAQLGPGRSVSDLARRLRLPGLTTAETVVRLMADGLLTPIEISELAELSAMKSDQLIEPQRTDVVVDVTEGATAGAMLEEPSSDLDARWRNLRTSRDEMPQ